MDSDFIRAYLARGVRNHVIALVVLAASWGLLSFALPDGWWHPPINIVAFLMSSGIGVSVKRVLALLGNPGWLAWLLAVVIWGFAIVGVRSAELSILEASF